MVSNNELSWQSLDNIIVSTQTNKQTGIYIGLW